ncbi:GIY-YIG nuclease family protein [Rugamonas sp. A1-17]|nr:GIY-YIG nuclease family protein [Rugamonas sp. A1-17]
MSFSRLPARPGQLNWARLGRLGALEGTDRGGVYLLVHEGKFNRVIYVGTTGNFAQRFATHLEGYLSGYRSIWKAQANEDIYALMTSWHLKNQLKYYQTLAQRGALWGTTTLATLNPRNLLAPGQRFNDEWDDFVRKEYLPHIVAWGLKLEPYDARYAALIESAIQQRLVQVFRLGVFFKRKDLSVLGKIEFFSRLIRIRESFANLPDVDAASKLVLSSLAEKHVPAAALKLAAEQLHDTLSMRQPRLEKLAARRAQVADKYPRQGTKWEPVDEEKLRVMLVDFDMSPAAMSPILERKAASIRRHIEQRDRFTAGAWRNARPRA